MNYNPSSEEQYHQDLKTNLSKQRYLSLEDLKRQDKEGRLETQKLFGGKLEIPDLISKENLEKKDQLIES